MEPLLLIYGGCMLVFKTVILAQCYTLDMEDTQCCLLTHYVWKMQNVAY